MFCLLAKRWVILSDTHLDAAYDKLQSEIEDYTCHIDLGRVEQRS